MLAKKNSGLRHLSLPVVFQTKPIPLMGRLFLLLDDFSNKSDLLLKKEGVKEKKEARSKGV